MNKIIPWVVVALALIATIVGISAPSIPTNSLSPAKQLKDSNTVVVQKTDPSTSQVNFNWDIYRNEQHGFEIEYPKGWAIEECRGEFQGQCAHITGSYKVWIYLDYVDVENIAKNLPADNPTETNIMIGGKAAIRKDYRDASGHTILSLITFSPIIESMPFFHISIRPGSQAYLRDEELVSAFETIETLVFYTKKTE